MLEAWAEVVRGYMDHVLRRKRRGVSRLIFELIENTVMEIPVSIRRSRYGSLIPANDKLDEGIWYNQTCTREQNLFSKIFVEIRLII